jgi:hypothetical protein
VIGRYGDIVGVWIAPVTAQVTMTLRRRFNTAGAAGLTDEALLADMLGNL